MRVLLISPNVETLPDPVFPLGLAYIAASLEQHQTGYQILDLCFASDYDAAIRSAISSFQPDVIGLSFRNVDNVSYPNYVSYLPFYRQVLNTIRKHTRASIVVGGSGFSLMPEEILRYLKADFGIAGEAERSFVTLIDELEGKKDHHQAPKHGILDYQRGVMTNLDDIPIPDRSGFDNEAYLKWGGMGNVQTKRGCPFQCIYCSYPIIEGRGLRLRDPGLVCDEIESLLEQKIDTLFFVDNAFNHPVEHAQLICQEIITRRLPIKWSCYANPKFVHSELIESMLAAGCTGVEFGSDAANEIMLVNLRKGFVVDDLRSASTICRHANMSFCHSLLLGGPGETMETVRQTFDTILEISPTAVICMAGIRVFPRTRLSDIAMREGIIGSEQDFLEPVFYLSPAVAEELLPFIEEFAGNNPSWIFPGLNINIDVALQKKLRRFGIKGPLWEYMKVGKRFAKS